MSELTYTKFHVQKGTAAASNVDSVSFSFSEEFKFIPHLTVTAKDPDAHVSLTVSNLSKTGATIQISSPVPDLVVSYIAMGRERNAS